MGRAGDNGPMSQGRVWVVALLCGLALALGFGLAFGLSFGLDDEGPTVTVTTSVQTTTAAQTTDEATERALQVWLVSGERLELRHRLVPVTETPARAALEELLKGSTGALASAVPPGTRLLGLSLSDGEATVDLSSAFNRGGGSLGMRLRVAQVVYTLTQFENVSRVNFAIDGEPVTAIGGEGVIVPAARDDFEDLLPVIVVEEPYPRQRVANPFRVRGTANVFEANVTLVVKDQAGRQLLRTFTTASCGTGCRGDYQALVRLPEGTPAQLLTLVVADDDADGNGRPQHQVQLLFDYAP